MKRVAPRFEQKPEKNNEVVTPSPPTPPPALLATPPIVPSKSSYCCCAYSKVVDGCKSCKKKSWKKARLQKQLSENTENMNVIKKTKTIIE